MKKIICGLLFLATSMAFVACDDDDDEDSGSDAPLVLSLNNLPPLDGGLLYEGWAIIDGEPVSTGKFNIDEDGDIVDSDGDEIDAGGFELDIDLSAATAIVITIEPAGDDDTVPAATKILAGDVSNGSANLTVSHSAALGSDFSSAAGMYILRTPTDGDDVVDSVNERSGIWFLSALPPAAGLTLPTLPDGWQYEGWAVTNGTPLSTGRFTDPAAADLGSPFSTGGPAFPGEDFLNNAPTGLTFPVDLRGGAAVISIEPEPDDSAAPFAFKPLVHDIPTDAVASLSNPATTYTMNNEAANNTTNVTGTATINN